MYVTKTFGMRKSMSFPLLFHGKSFFQTIFVQPEFFNGQKNVNNKERLRRIKENFWVPSLFIHKIKQRKLLNHARFLVCPQFCTLFGKMGCLCCINVDKNFYLILLILFIYRTSESLLAPTTKLYIYQQVCFHELTDNNLPPSDDLCFRLENLTDLEEKIQIKAANILQIYRIAMYLPSFVVTIFCGSCSDEFGRKLPMMATCVSLIVASATYYISTKLFMISIILVIIGSTLSAFLGKNSLLLMATQSYVIDITNFEIRTPALTFLQAMGYLGQALGSFLSGLLLEFFTYDYLFLVVLITNIFLMVLIMCTLDETRKEEIGDESSFKRIKEFAFGGANWKYLKQSFSVLWKPRATNRTLYLVLFLITIYLYQFIHMGIIDVMLLYVEQSPFYWPDSYYGYYLSFVYLSLGICQLVIPFVNSYLDLKDVVLIIMGMGTKFTEFIILIFASQSWLVWFFKFNHVIFWYFQPREYWF